MEIRRGQHTIRLGPLTSTVVDRARWDAADEYPAWQFFADEAERLFAFAESRGVFEMYLSELTGPSNQRDSALSELRVAFYFDRNGFRVTEWRPVGEARKEGEFAIACPSGESVFVEVKSPGWEFELGQAERLAGRTKHPKYIDGEGRSLANDEAIVFAVEKAYPKFAATRHNLLVVVDDLFVSLEHGTDMWARGALYNQPEGKFTSSACERLGGVGCFWWATDYKNVWYEMPLFLNHHAAAECKLPGEFVKAFHGVILAAG